MRNVFALPVELSGMGKPKHMDSQVDICYCNQCIDVLKFGAYLCTFTRVNRKTGRFVSEFGYRPRQGRFEFSAWHLITTVLSFQNSDIAGCFRLGCRLSSATRVRGDIDEPRCVLLLRCFGERRKQCFGSFAQCPFSPLRRLKDASILAARFHPSHQCNVQGDMCP